MCGKEVVPMVHQIKVAVLSRSFSANDTLMSELRSRFSEVKPNDTGRTLRGPELVNFLAGYTHAVVALETVNDELLQQLPNLQVIGKYGVGLNNVDLHACERRGVRVGWTGGVNRRSVAELSVCLAIASLRRVVETHTEIRDGVFRQLKGLQLSGRTVGLLGCGHVGKTSAKLFRALGCSVLAHDIRSFPEFYEENAVTPVGLDQLLAESDVISIHLPYTPATQNILSRDRLLTIKPGAVLINTARGGLVDERALKERLVGGFLHGAAFDVFDPEPPVDTELLRLPNFIATGHIGGSAEEAILAMGMAAIDGLENPINATDHIQDYER